MKSINQSGDVPQNYLGSLVSCSAYLFKKIRLEYGLSFFLQDLGLILQPWSCKKLVTVFVHMYVQSVHSTKVALVL
jgi:hypothetical protein